MKKSWFFYLINESIFLNYEKEKMNTKKKGAIKVFKKDYW